MVPITPHEDFSLRPARGARGGSLADTRQSSYPLHRNMVILRLATGELVLHSVVAMEEAGLRALEALGTPAYSIVPSLLHVMDAPFYKAALSRHEAAPARRPRWRRSARRWASTARWKTSCRRWGSRSTRAGHEGGGVRLRVPDPRRRPALWSPTTSGSAHAADDSRLLGRLVVSHIAVPGIASGFPASIAGDSIIDVAAVRNFAGDLATIPDLRLITVSHGDPVATAPADALRSVATS